MATNTTFLEIQNNVLKLLSKTDDTTRNRVKGWINLGQQDFVMRELWPFRESTATLPVTGGTQEYSLVDDVAEDIDAGNIVSVATIGSGGKKLKYVPFQKLRAAYGDLSVNPAPAQFYYIKNGNIGIYPAPDDDFEVDIDYYIVPTELEVDGDETVIPLGYREALIHYALALEHDYNTDPDLAIKSQNRYEQIIKLARVNLLAQPPDSDGFTIEGASDSRWTGLRSEAP